MIDFGKLRAPFPPERISWRVGSTNADKTRGLALAYLDARDVQDRLDEVCGPENWQNRYPHANGKTVCEIGINVSGGVMQTPSGFDPWIWKADGAGDTDVEAEKGALSDAFKRAAVKWGIGRYLYDLESPWVALEPAGRSYKIKDSEMPKLRALLGGKPAPQEPASESPSNVFASSALIDIAQMKTMKALTTWAAINHTHLEALPDDLKAKVRDAYTRKHNSLKQEAA